MTLVTNNTANVPSCGCSIAAQKKSLELKESAIINKAYAKIASDTAALFTVATVWMFLMKPPGATPMPILIPGVGALFCGALNSIFMAEVNSSQELAKLHADLATTHKVSQLPA